MIVKSSCGIQRLVSLEPLFRLGGSGRHRSCASGQCIQAFSNGKIPHCVKFNPDEDKQHIFLAGMQDKKIIQVRLNSKVIATQAMS